MRWLVSMSESKIATGMSARVARSTAATSALRSTGARSLIGDGQMAEFVFNGTPYVLCHVDGQVYAMNGICPHRGGPLIHGALHGHTVVCPWHGWEFDCREGGVPVHVQDGDIYLEL